MTDIDTVIKGLERCKVGCKNCPYYGVENCIIAIRDDALEALKEQREKIEAAKRWLSASGVDLDAIFDKKND